MSKDETRKRAASDYWLVREMEGGLHLEIITNSLDSPAAAWEYAKEHRLEGKLHVLCHRGSKQGGNEYALV